MESWINITIREDHSIYFHVNEMKIDNKHKNIIKKSIDTKTIKLYMNLNSKPDTYPMCIFVNQYDEVYICTYNERPKIEQLAFRAKRINSHTSFHDV